MEKSNTIVYDNGDMLNHDKCRAVLLAYWELNEAETRAFDRLHKRADLIAKYLEILKEKNEK